MFDEILNTTLSEEISAIGVKQGNLELPLHQTQKQDEILE